MDSLRSPSVFGLFLISDFVTLAHDILHRLAFFSFAEHNSLSGMLAFIPVPPVPVPECRSMFFPFVKHNSFSGLLVLLIDSFHIMSS